MLRLLKYTELREQRAKMEFKPIARIANEIQFFASVNH